MRPLQKEESAGYLTNLMARLFASMLSDALRPLNLAPAPFAILLELWQTDGLTQRDIVDRLEIEQPTATNTLARMERDGLIRRVPDQHDTRVKRILLTDKARRLQGQATRSARFVNQQALSGLTEQERIHLLALIRRVIEQQRAHLSDTAPSSSQQETTAMNQPVDAPPPQDNLPADVQQALAGNAEARQRFNALPPSHQREYLTWIDEAKRDSTRQRRTAGMIERLLATPPGQKGQHCSHQASTQNVPGRLKAPRTTKRA